jgi:hypothetical protein
MRRRKAIAADALHVGDAVVDIRSIVLMIDDGE